MEFADTLFLIVIIIFSVVIHEVMHGVAADRLGDPTARYAGRLTLNPIPHIDLFGSIIVPVFMVLASTPYLFAWAKPVPYNPYNLRTDGLFARFSEAIVAGAGPLSNLILALLTGAIMQLVELAPEVNAVLFLVVLVNVMLFLFNLFPIPPLDGSKILSSILPGGMAQVYDGWRARMEQNPFLGMGLVLLVVVLFGQTFGAFVFQVARLIAGV